MLTYKVLLVDDEEEVMDTIEHRISWNEMGFEVIGKARNGVKALEISEKMQPDVVITDIKMPYMDGLELARNLKQDNPDMRILILTGVRDRTCNSGIPLRDLDCTVCNWWTYCALAEN